MKKFTIVAALVGAVALAGCQDFGPKQGAGTLIGAAGGGLLGSQFGSGGGKLAATAAGVLIGAWLGNSVGSSLDRSDQLYAERTYNQAFEGTRSGTESSWRNPDSGNYGTVTPTRTYQNAGRDCREFTQTIYIQGRAQTGTGTACRNGDGTWAIVNG
ncbi:MULTISPECIES: RT0821/Lpp0805 family surface protein [Inquilinus]|uniref:17 kDa surface antigen n=1 Tax=Inquilinus ginsengisoli TaxID=363840 RepID=A0ABU1JU58_9PROT|nr:RT0821/Lpp0805 family surface protein [Inquilinus ginsengisoli]MDR6292156.1 surface antigen [Inquilinus ginsengisoli]